MLKSQEAMNFTQIMNDSFVLYKKSLGGLYPLSLLAMVLTYSPFLFFEIWSPEIALQRGIYHENQVLISLLALGVAFGVMASLIDKQNAIMLGQNKSIVDSLKSTFYDYLPLFMVAILYIIVVICGTVLLIFPGIILSISLMFSLIIRITEKKNILDCLIYSHRLVWGNWWASLILISIPLLINFTISILLFIAIVGILDKFPATVDHALTFAFIAHTLLQAIILPFVFSTALILINKLKVKNQNL